MMMFLLGVLVTWLVLSFLYVICDDWCDYNIIDRVIGLPFYFIVDTYRIISVLDLCIIYHIPINKPISLATIGDKLDDKGKEKWVQRMPKEQQEKWRKVLDIQHLLCYNNNNKRKGVEDNEKIQKEFFS